MHNVNNGKNILLLCPFFRISVFFSEHRLIERDGNIFYEFFDIVSIFEKNTC